jgi:Sulfotransferase family
MVSQSTVPDAEALEVTNGCNLVFLVGCPRSGTTWLQRLLASHPAVRSGPESDIFSFYVGPSLRAFRADRQRSRRKGLQCYTSEDEFVELQRSFVLRMLRPALANLQDGELFLEKTPRHALYIPEILSCFPAARFIHLIRDPRDTTASLLAASRSWGVDWAPTTAASAGRMWLKYVSAARAASREVSPKMFLQVTYEDLHADTKAELAKCAYFLGLPWDSAGISDAIEKNRPAQLRSGGGTPFLHGASDSSVTLSEPSEPVGFIRKAQPGSWREDLTTAEKLQLWRVVRRDLLAFGYSWPELRFLEPLVSAVEMVKKISVARRRLNRNCSSVEE